MGCRDCNNSLETCQNALDAAESKLFRAATALGGIGSVFDEYDETVRAIARTKGIGQGQKVADEAVSHAFMQVFEIIEKWLLTEEEASE